jgi:hypothetical protein
MQGMKENIMPMSTIFPAGLTGAINLDKTEKLYNLIAFFLQIFYSLGVRFACSFGMQT